MKLFTPRLGVFGLRAGPPPAVAGSVDGRPSARPPRPLARVLVRPSVRPLVRAPARPADGHCQIAGPMYQE